MEQSAFAAAAVLAVAGHEKMPPVEDGAVPAAANGPVAGEPKRLDGGSAHGFVVTVGPPAHPRLRAVVSGGEATYCRAARADIPARTAIGDMLAPI